MFSLSIPSSTTDPHNGVTYYQLQLQFQFQLDINNTSIHSTSSSSEGCWRAFKRYSAFESLHALLLPLLTASNSLSLVSPLPSKYALPLPSLVQTRRLGLEKYLLDITFNDKLLHIRASPAFLDFIQVPSHLRQHLLDYFKSSSSSSSNPNSIPHITAIPSTHILYSPEDWIINYRKTESLCSELKSKYSSSNSDNYDAHKNISILTIQIQKLDESLASHQQSLSITPGEIQRRLDLISNLKLEKDALFRLAKHASSSSGSLNTMGGSGRFNNSSSINYKAERSALLNNNNGGNTSSSNNNPSSPPSFNPGSLPTSSSFSARLNNNTTSSTSTSSSRKFGIISKETLEKTSSLSNTQILSLQSQTLQQQDDSLDALSAILQRQREIGAVMGRELDLQNVLLDGVDEGVERVQGGIKIADRKIQRIMKG